MQVCYICIIQRSCLIIFSYEKLLISKINYGMTFILSHSIKILTCCFSWPCGVSTCFPESLTPPAVFLHGGREENEQLFSFHTWDPGSERTNLDAQPRRGTINHLSGQ